MPTDLTTYLGECNSRGERPLAVIHGMDCVAHEEIIPYASCETKPVDHELFERIFEVRSGSTEESSGFFVVLWRIFAFFDWIVARFTCLDKARVRFRS